MIWPGLQRGWFLRVDDFAGATPWLHTPIRLYADYGVVLFAGVLLVAWWWARAARDPYAMAAALWAPLGALLAIGLNQPIVDLVAEPRPYWVFPDALLLVGRSQDYAFPSDHAVMAGAVAAGVWLVDRRLGIPVVVAALLMAFARVYVGAHFPLDVIAGLAFGAIVTVLGFLATRTVIAVLVTRLSRTPLRPLLTADDRVLAR